MGTASKRGLARGLDWYEPEPPDDPDAPPHSTRCHVHRLYYRGPSCAKCDQDERNRRSDAEAAAMRGEVPEAAREAGLAGGAKSAERKLPLTQRRGLEHHNGKKTHCKRGHPFTPENTIAYRGERKCRGCGRIYGRVAWRRRQESGGRE